MEADGSKGQHCRQSANCQPQQRLDQRVGQRTDFLSDDRRRVESPRAPSSGSAVQGEGNDRASSAGRPWTLTTTICSQAAGFGKKAQRRSEDERSRCHSIAEEQAEGEGEIMPPRSSHLPHNLERSILQRMSATQGRIDTNASGGQANCRNAGQAGSRRNWWPAEAWAIITPAVTALKAKLPINVKLPSPHGP